MSRGLWFVAGAGAGVYAAFRGRRAAEALTPEGLGDRLNGLGVGLRIFRDEVALGRAEKESALRERLAAAPPGRIQLAIPTGTTDGRAIDAPDEEGNT